jgi:hypothetical protein
LEVAGFCKAFLTVALFLTAGLEGFPSIANLFDAFSLILLSHASTSSSTVESCFVEGSGVMGFMDSELLDDFEINFLGNLTLPARAFIEPSGFLKLIAETLSTTIER